MTRAAVMLVVLAALTSGVRSFAPTGSQMLGPGTVLAFGFLLLGAANSGKLFKQFGLPRLTGFIFCGVVFGPELLGLITPAMVKDLAVLKRVSVGLIGLLTGLELNLRLLAPRLPRYLAISGTSLLGAMLPLFAFFWFLSAYLPATLAMDPTQRLIVSLICSVVLATLSPAVVTGVLTETRSAGPLSELVLAVVVLADLLLTVAFSVVGDLARGVLPSSGAGSGSLAFHIFGSLGVGAALGGLLSLYAQRVSPRVGLFAFAVLFVVAEAGHVLHLDPLLMGLSAGLFLENISPVKGEELLHKLEPVTLPTFAVFFAVVGAEVHLQEFLSVAAVSVGAAVVRGVGLWGGSRVGAGLTRTPPAQGRKLILGLLPQAGVSIAFANLVRASFPGWGGEMATLLLGTIVVNEMIGPALFRLSLSWAGEIDQKRTGGASEHAAHAPVEEQPA
jgi:Kef-type K+ transport system membrane component KefB